VDQALSRNLVLISGSRGLYWLTAYRLA
jgi:hypothetical protein